MKGGVALLALVMALVVGLAVLGLAFQSAPTPASARVYTNEPPGDGETMDAGTAFATISAYAKYTGASARLRATSDASDGLQYFDVTVKCGARLVWGAQYRPSLTLAREWYTFAKESGTPDKFVDAGEECVLTVRAKWLPPGSVAISLAGTGGDISAVMWGEPSSSTSTNDAPGTPSTATNGTYASTEPTTTCATPPCEPPPAFDVGKVAVVLVVAVLALVIVAALVTRRRRGP